MKVCVAYPHAQNVSAQFHTSLLHTVIWDSRHNQRITNGGGDIAAFSGPNLSQPRNLIVQAFLDNHTADWLWFVDTDMVFAPDTLDRMVESADPESRPILGALCFTQAALPDGRIAPTLFTLRENQLVRMYDYPRDETIEVAATGAGCLLIHRSALKIMKSLCPPPNRWFQAMVRNGESLSEDLIFCLRAKECGFKIYVDTGIQIGHEKTYVVDQAAYEMQCSVGVIQ